MSGDQRKAVVLHSGGQDSTTCLGWAIDKFGAENVLPLSIFYYQKHQIEIDCAIEICCALGVNPPENLPLEALAILEAAALTNPDIEVAGNASGTGNIFAEEHGLPSTFVPGRNLLLLTLAAAYGAKHGAYDLVTGVCETDAAGYPDCRASFVLAAQVAISEALSEEVQIHAPLLERSKAETFEMARDLGILEIVLKHSHTCYQGDHETLNDWGFGCGDCPACIERRKGWEGFQASLEAA